MAQQLHLAILPQFYTITYNINYKNGIEQHKLDQHNNTQVTYILGLAFFHTYFPYHKCLA